VTGDTLSVDGQELKTIGLDGPAPHRTVLWVPSAQTVLGGVLVFANEHVWIADTQTAQARADWKDMLDAISALNPTSVIPGHYALNADGSQPFSLASVAFTRQYIEDFETEAAQAADSGALTAAMQRLYAGIPGEQSLAISAKVIKGEMTWPTK
jgi:glyoxylase-like metal-dependent hydrolase (beta-lactamase superfamily II)